MSGIYANLKKHRFPLLLLGGVLLLIGLPLALAERYQFMTLTRLNQLWHDTLFLARGAVTPERGVVILAINDESMDILPEDEEEYPDLALLREWPWPRAVHAMIIEQLMEAGARGVGFDILFPTPSLYGPGDDAVLRESLLRHRGKVFVGANFDLLQTGDDSRSYGLLTPHENILRGEEEMADFLAFINFPTEHGGIIRRVNFFQSIRMNHNLTRNLLPDAPLWKNFAARLAYLNPSVQERGLPEKGVHPVYFFGPSRTFPQIPVYQLFHDEYWERNLADGEVFRDQFVLIGATANFMQDMHPTPFGIMAGVEVHANALAMLLEDRLLREARPGQIDAMLWAGVVLGFLLIWWTKNFLLAGGLLVVGSGIYLGGGYLLFSRGAFVLGSVAPLLAFGGSGVLTLVARFTQEQMQKLRLRRMLSTFVSRDVAEHLIAHPELMRQAQRGNRRTCVILFSDVRNFTTLTESAESPEAFVDQLNEYLSAWVESVFAHRGTLDKFVGDAVMAVWGNFTSRGVADDARRALLAAAEMKERLKVLNERWAREGKPLFHIGTGINCGEVISGNMGSPGMKLEFTVIGDAVNTAARLESETKNAAILLREQAGGKDLPEIDQATTLYSEEVHQLIGEPEIGYFVQEAHVKGRAKPVRMYVLTKAPRSTDDSTAGKK